MESSTSPRWQIHLSTAVVLMFIAGAMLYPLISVFDEAFDPSANISNSPDWYSPLDFVIVFAVAMGVLFGAGVLCEFIIRRRVEHKP